VAVAADYGNGATAAQHLHEDIPRFHQNPSEEVGSQQLNMTTAIPDDEKEMASMPDDDASLQKHGDDSAAFTWHQVQSTKGKEVPVQEIGWEWQQVANEAPRPDDQ
jgi:hypothetical protein